MKKMKKLFAMFLAVVMLFSMLPAQQAQAASKVKLNKTKATIYVGGSTTLKVTGTKSTVKWSTSKKSVATVSNKGKVVGKKSGTATITAKVGKKSYTCKVTVKKPNLNKTKVALKAGDKYQLKITGTTAKKWTSSKKSVATVSNKGKVTAKKSGTTTITCTGKDKKTYKCTVTVKGKAALNKTKLTLTVGDKYQLKITGTTAKKWTSSKTSVATVDKKGKVTAKKAGTTTITCTGKDKKTYQCTITVKAKAADKDTHTHTHSYTWKVTKNATCTAEGEKVYQCSCGHIQKTEKIAKTAHTYQQKKTAATCTENGYTTYTCTVCKKSYKDNYVDALEHDFGEYTYNNDATTTKDGTETATCSRCGTKDTRTVADTKIMSRAVSIKIDQLNEKGSDGMNFITKKAYPAGSTIAFRAKVPEGATWWAVSWTTNPSDTGLYKWSPNEGGLGQAMTSVVGEWSDYSVTLPNDGKQYYIYIVGEKGKWNEKELLIDDVVITNASGTKIDEDNFDNGIKNGIFNIKTATNGSTVVSGIGICVNGHTVVIDKGKEATCTESGLSDGSHCSVCGKVIKKQEVQKVLGHNFVDGKCKNCGKDYVNIVASIKIDLLNEGANDGKPMNFITKEAYPGGSTISFMAKVPEGASWWAVSWTTNPSDTGLYKWSPNEGGLGQVMTSVVGEWSKYSATLPNDGQEYYIYIAGAKGEWGGKELLMDEVVIANASGETIVEDNFDKFGIKNGIFDIIEKNSSDEIVVSEVEIVDPCKNGHAEEKRKGKEATCTEPGLSDGVFCTRCEKWVTPQTEIEALGHKYDMAGDRKCKTCGKDYVNIVASININQLKEEAPMSFITKEAYAGGSTVSFKAYVPEGVGWWGVCWTTEPSDTGLYKWSPNEGGLGQAMNSEAGKWSDYSVTLPDDANKYYIYIVGAKGEWKDAETSVDKMLLIDEVVIAKDSETSVEDNFDNGIKNGIFSIIEGTEVVTEADKCKDGHSYNEDKVCEYCKAEHPCKSGKHQYLNGTCQNCEAKDPDAVSIDKAAAIYMSGINDTGSMNFITTKAYPAGSTVSFKAYVPSGASSDSWWRVYYSTKNTDLTIYEGDGATGTNVADAAKEGKWADYTMTLPEGEEAYYIYIAGGKDTFWNEKALLVDNFKVTNPSGIVLVADDFNKGFTDSNFTVIRNDNKAVSLEAVETMEEAAIEFTAYAAPTVEGQVTVENIEKLENAYLQLTEAGFNKAIAMYEGYSTVDDVQAELGEAATIYDIIKKRSEKTEAVTDIILDIAEQNHISYYVKDWSFYGLGRKNTGDNSVVDSDMLAAAVGETTTENQFQTIISTMFGADNPYVAHPAYAGNFGFDEPYRSDFTTVAWQVKYYNEAKTTNRSNGEMLVNLLPAYVDDASEQFEVTTGRKDGTYSKYLDAYITDIASELGYISWDNYPFMASTVDNKVKTTREQKYLYNLALIADKCKGKNIELRTYVQAIAENDGEGNASLRAIEGIDDLRFQIYSGLAFGVNEFIYYVYSGNGNDYMYNYNTQQTNKVYDYAKQVNNEVHGIEDVYSKYQWSDVMYKKAAATSTWLDGLDTLNKSSDGTYTIETKNIINITSCTQDTLTGIFTAKEDEEQNAFMFVNVADPSNDASSEITVQFANDIKEVMVYQQGEEKKVSLSEAHETKFNLASGEGIFVVPVVSCKHNVVTDAAVAATCTTPGKTAGSHCDICNTVLVEQTVIPALGHKGIDGVCKVCNQEYVDKAAAIHAQYLQAEGTMNFITSEAYPGGSTVTFRAYVPEGTKNQWWKVGYSTVNTNLSIYPANDATKDKNMTSESQEGQWAEYTVTLPESGNYYIYIAGADGITEPILVDDFVITASGGTILAREDFNECKDGFDNNSIFTVTEKRNNDTAVSLVEVEKSSKAAAIYTKNIEESGTMNFITSKAYPEGSTVTFQAYVPTSSGGWWTVGYSTTNENLSKYAGILDEATYGKGQNMTAATKVEQWAEYTVTLPEEKGNYYIYIAGADITEPIQVDNFVVTASDGTILAAEDFNAGLGKSIFSVTEKSGENTAVSLVDVKEVNMAASINIDTLNESPMSFITKQAYAGGSTVTFKAYVPEESKKEDGSYPWWAVCWTTDPSNTGLYKWTEGLGQTMTSVAGEWSTYTVTLPDDGNTYYIYIVGAKGEWNKQNLLVDDVVITSSTNESLATENFNNGLENGIFSIAGNDVVTLVDVEESTESAE